MELWEMIRDTLEEMSSNDLMYIWNEYCDNNRYYDDKIYYYEEIDEFYYDMKPTEIIEKFGELGNCEYWKDGIYGAEALDMIEDGIDFDDLAQYIADNEDSMGYNDLQDTIDEWYEQNEEEEEEE